MEFHTSKSKVLHITRKCHPYVHVYKLKGQVLDSLHPRSVKYLQCVYLSDDLHRNEHIKTISNKANKTLGFLKQNSIHCPPRTNSHNLGITIKYSFYPRTITEWNKLPRDIALSNSLAAFENAISNIY